MSSKNSNEKWLIYVKSDNRKVVIGADKVEIITELFDSFMERNKQSATQKQPMNGRILCLIIHWGITLQVS